jgi:hypothetical protein
LALQLCKKKNPKYGSTAGLYFFLSKDDDHVAMLACAHIICPPLIYHSIGLTKASLHWEEIIALGTKAYDNVISTITTGISTYNQLIAKWNSSLQNLGDSVKGKDSRVTMQCDKLLLLVQMAAIVI